MLTPIILVVLFSLVLVYFLRTPLAGFVSGASGLLLFLFLAIALSALLWPAGYTALAETSLEQLGVLGEARQLDTALAPVTDLQGDVAGLARDLLGIDVAPAPRPEAQPGGRGLFEGTLARILVPIVATILRAVALITSVTGMIVVLALSYAGRAVRDLQHVRAQQAALEARLAALEADET
jgi:hypothetical protein